MNLLQYTLQSLSLDLINILTTVITVPILIILLYVRNLNIAKIQKYNIGMSINSPIEQTIAQIVLGVIAGIIGSIIISMSGGIFSIRNIPTVIFMIVLFKFIFKMRRYAFILASSIGLFAYLAYFKISEILNGTKSDYSVLSQEISSIFILIGVIAILEGILTIIDGHNNAVACIGLKDDESGTPKVFGFFMYNAVWVTPLLIIYLFVPGKDVTSNFLEVKSLEVLLNSAFIKSSISIISMVAFSFINYNDFTSKDNKYIRNKKTGIVNMIFGIIILLCSSVVHIDYYVALYICIFIEMIIVIIILIDKKVDDKKEFYYITKDDGVMVLDVDRNSIAYKLKIRSGDKILKINDVDITKEKFESVLKNIGEKFSLEFQKQSGEILKTSYEGKKQDERLGFIYVPKEIDMKIVIENMEKRLFKYKLKTKKIDKNIEESLKENEEDKKDENDEENK